MVNTKFSLYHSAKNVILILLRAITAVLCTSYFDRIPLKKVFLPVSIPMPCERTFCGCFPTAVAVSTQTQHLCELIKNTSQ